MPNTLDAPNAELEQDFDLSLLDEKEAELDKRLAAQADALPPIEAEPDKETSGETPKALSAGTQAAGTVKSAKGEEGKPSEPGKAGTPEASAKTPEGLAKETKEAKAEGEEKGADGKPLTRYQKEVQRRDQSWKKLNEEKAVIEQQKAEIAAEKLKLQEEKARKETETPEYTPEDYEKNAELFEKQGRLDLAEAARAEAKKLRETPAADVHFKSAQKASWQKAVSKLPELNVKDSPAQQRLAKFIDANGALFQESPRAFEVAAEILSAQTDAEKYKTDASRVPELQKQVEEMKAKITELTAKLTPSGDGGGDMPGEKKFEDMTHAEQKKALEREAAQLDG
jgi:hypothetical protein